jgi:hypothetical protein
MPQQRNTRQDPSMARDEMTPAARETALGIMGRLMEHPITRPLHSRFSVDRLDFRTPDSPGLSTVTQRLSDQTYKSVYEWITDVEAVVHNFELASHEGFAEFAIAREVRRLFLKERATMRFLTTASWSGRLVHLKQRLLQLNNAAPPKIRSQAPLPAFPRPRPIQHSMATGHQIQCLRTACEWLEPTDDVRGLLRYGQGLNSRELAEATDYVKGRLVKRGLGYPE